MVSVVDYTPGHMGGLELRRVTLVQHQSGRLWLVDAAGAQVERKVDSVANVVGGPKLAAARLDHTLTVMAGRSPLWIGKG